MNLPLSILQQHRRMVLCLDRKLTDRAFRCRFVGIVRHKGFGGANRNNPFSQFKAFLAYSIRNRMNPPILTVVTAMTAAENRSGLLVLRVAGTKI